MRNGPGRWILHLGLGSFHRAHQAAYLQRLHDAGELEWGIAAGNIRSGMEKVVGALAAQEGAYTLETVSPDGSRSYERIRSIRRVIALDAGHPKLIACAADPATRIVSFTVTEAGYYFDAAGRLDLSHPDVAADVQELRRGEGGRTLYGALARLLRARRDARAGKVTLLCCDNLRANGTRSREGLLRFVEQVGDDALASWIRENTTSPDSMVDRITPRPTEELRERVLRATGDDDEAPVMAETFIQWVIEDDFCNARPAWERAGAEMVRSVHPYEEAKIRLLNAAHSAIAWGGTLRGHRFIHEGVADPLVREIAFEYATQDAIPCLRPSPLDLERYRDTVLDRFRNAALADTNERVAMDSYAKLQGFVAPTVRERLRRGESIDAVAMLPALYLAFLARWDRGGIGWAYADSMLDAASAHTLARSADRVAALCADPRLWSECANDVRFVEAVRRALLRAEALAVG